MEVVELKTKVLLLGSGLLRIPHSVLRIPHSALRTGLRRAIITALHMPHAGVKKTGQRGDLSDVKRIVVVRPDHLGDLLFATPAIERLKQAFPGAHIAGLVGPWGRAMWEGNSNLDALYTMPFPGIEGRKRGGPLTPYRLLSAAAGRLKRGEFELGVVLRFDHWWGAALLKLAGIPYRWGYGTPGMGTWLTDKAPYTAGRHEVEQNLLLTERVIQAMYGGARVQRVGPLHIDREQGEPPLRPPQPTPPKGDWAGSWLAAPRRAAIHPGTGAANKLWTVQGWEEVASYLIEQGWAVALTGSPSERPLADAIEKAVGEQHAMPLQRGSLSNLAGCTANIGELAWVLKGAHMALGVDSGPLHIATALGKPTLHLYGPSDETLWGPWGDPRRHRALRAPGTEATMRLDVGAPGLEGGPEMKAITPEMVLRELGDLLAQTRND